ncbi:MAG: glycogenin glucosyltransferase [Geoglossum simile]|nr:MAG: glycogenin glucosyltransferase [Geoglossum simile]
MAVEGKEDAYCTLLTSDNYLPGALVLGHSLRDAGTKKKLAIAVVMDSLRASSIAELKKLYDYVIPVERLTNKTPANLYLMDRPDLVSSFTKIYLWRLLQFRKIVYIDADAVATRAPDELFDLDANFAAAPDIGWPDCFNSGVMVFKPNMADFYSLLALAQRGISFDGADQGLLNTHFRNWQRISFTYNVTPSGNYQYLPAFRHFGSNVSMVHFIGAEKPWMRGRDPGKEGSESYDELLGRWWSVYDRHYRAPTTGYYAGQASIPPAYTVQQYVKGEVSRDSYGFSSSEVPKAKDPKKSEKIEIEKPEPEIPETLWKTVEPLTMEEPSHPGFEHPQPSRTQASALVEQTRNREQTYIREQTRNKEQTHNRGECAHDQGGQTHDLGSGNPPEERPFSPPIQDWDPARFPPPLDSRPEASNLPHPIYNMSQDSGLFVAPPIAPPPKGLWYQVPAGEPLKQLFPWEATAPPASRVFPEDMQGPPQSGTGVTTTDDSMITDQGTDFVADPVTDLVADLATDQTTISPTSFVPSIEPWETYRRSNAWDEIPDIDRFITSLRQMRHGKVQVLVGDVTSSGNTVSAIRIASNRITDFPSEIERPSLPVTPAPVRRPNFWSTERNEEGELPTAEGVPKQDDWVSHGGFWFLIMSISWAMLIVLLEDGVGPCSPARGAHKKGIGRVTKAIGDRKRRSEGPEERYSRSYPAWLVGPITDEQQGAGGGRVWDW